MPQYTAGTPVTWTYWTNQTSSTATVDQWQQWMGTVSTATTSVQNFITYWGNDVWQQWQSAGSVAVYDSWANTYGLVPQETEEQRTARLEREREQRERWERERAERDRLAAEAAERAQALLAEVLDEEQHAEYIEHQHFHVKVRDPRDRRFRTFRVGHGISGNVAELDEEGRALYRYCIHMYGGEPTEDHMVAQKLMLETDLEAFERIANRSTVHREPAPVAA